MQQTVFGRLDARDQIGGCHGDLLGFLEEVVDVLVQDHLADFLLWYIRPDFGGVQRVEVELGQFFRFQHLDVQVPFREVALLDGADQVVGQVAVVLGLNLSDFFRVEVLDALQRLPVELDVVHFALGVDQFVGVNAVAVHETVASRCAFVGVQQGQRARGFRYMREEVEAARVVVQVGTRVRLEGVHHVRELDSVADEERWEVIAYQVPVAVSGVELGGEAVRVAQGFRRVVAVDHGRKTYEYRGFFTRFEDGRLTKVADVGGRCEFAFYASAACVDYTLRDTLAIKALQLLQQLHVLQQDRPLGACGLRVLVVADRSAIVAGQGVRCIGSRNADKADGC